MAEIIRFRFQDHMTFPQSAQQYGIPTERVRHLCLKALDRLRRPEHFEIILLGPETVDAMRKSTEEATQSA